MMNSMLKKCTWMNTNTSLLILRIGIGAIFIMSGWMKVSDLTATVGMFGAMGIGAFWAYCASFGELLGGIMVLLGIYTRIGALILAITMAVAISLTYRDLAMMMTPFILFFVNLSLVFSGGGKFTLMKKMCGCGKCILCKNSGVEKTELPTS